MIIEISELLGTIRVISSNDSGNGFMTADDRIKRIQLMEYATCRAAEFVTQYREYEDVYSSIVYDQRFVSPRGFSITVIVEFNIHERDAITAFGQVLEHDVWRLIRAFMIDQDAPVRFVTPSKWYARLFNDTKLGSLCGLFLGPLTAPFHLGRLTRAVRDYRNRSN